MQLPAIWKSVGAALAADDRVRKVWLGGSWARGEADEFSDIDLALQVTADWDPSSLGALWVAGASQSLGGAPFFSVVVSDGTMLDLWILPEAPESYVPVDLPKAKRPPRVPPEAPGLVTDFWLNTHKHRKVIGRGLEAMAVFGLNHEKMVLLRLWALADTGVDPMTAGGNIHGLSPLIRNHVTPSRRCLLGLPCRDLREVVEAIEGIRDEVSQTGRLVEQRFGLSYPVRLEALVRSKPLPLKSVDGA